MYSRGQHAKASPRNFKVIDRAMARIDREQDLALFSNDTELENKNIEKYMVSRDRVKWR